MVRVDHLSVATVHCKRRLALKPCDRTYLIKGIGIDAEGRSTWLFVDVTRDRARRRDRICCVQARATLAEDPPEEATCSLRSELAGGVSIDAVSARHIDAQLATHSAGGKVFMDRSRPDQGIVFERCIGVDRD